MPYTEKLYDLMKLELVQLEEEGCDTAELKKEYEALPEEGPDKDKAAARLYKKAAKLKPRKDFPYLEPSEYAQILKKRSRGPRRFKKLPAESELKNKIQGAWLGRCAGCLLGKPVEPLGHNRKMMLDVLSRHGVLPLSDYLPRLSQGIPDYVHYEAWDEEYIPCAKENLSAAERDDDLDYTILGLYYLEKFGPDFKTTDVAMTWLSRLPYLRIYTAERIAYYNLVNNIEPPQSAGLNNPYREWIGAQIRADAFGYAAPGWPEKAAELAYRDASLSHVKNGIYGEMLMAAIISAAFAAKNVEEAIEAGLAEIPKTSRLYEAVKNVMAWAKEDNDPEKTTQRIHDTYGKYHSVHTINNAAIVIMALMYAGRDFEKGITLAVLGGWDTDCNGATVGSILGALLGRDGIPAKWSAPLNNTLKSDVVGFYVNRISDLAERTYTQAKRIIF